MNNYTKRLEEHIASLETKLAASEETNDFLRDYN